MREENARSGRVVAKPEELRGARAQRRNAVRVGDQLCATMRHINVNIKVSCHGTQHDGDQLLRDDVMRESG